MKSLPFIVAIAALLLGSFATVAEATAEAKVVHIGQRYSKAELDAICAREGGRAYGSADDIYCSGYIGEVREEFPYNLSGTEYEYMKPSFE